MRDRERHSRTLEETSNLSNAHVTRDSIFATTSRVHCSTKQECIFEGTQISCPAVLMENSLNIKSKLTWLKLHFMLKIISNASCFGLSPVVSMQYSAKLSVAAQNREKITKTYFLDFKVVQGYHVKLVSSKEQICVYMQPFCAKLMNCGRNRAFSRGTYISIPLFVWRTPRT